jgi:hypothetical protein
MARRRRQTRGRRRSVRRRRTQRQRGGEGNATANQLSVKNMAAKWNRGNFSKTTSDNSIKIPHSNSWTSTSQATQTFANRLALWKAKTNKKNTSLNGQIQMQRGGVLNGKIIPTIRNCIDNIRASSDSTEEKLTKLKTVCALDEENAQLVLNIGNMSDLQSGVLSKFDKPLYDPYTLLT